MLENAREVSNENPGTRLRGWLSKERRNLAGWEYILLLLCLLVFPLSLDRTPILHDEPDWIHQSLFLDLLLRGDLANPEWDVQHYTLTEPMLSRYIIGVGRMLGGYTLADLRDLERFYQGDPTYTVDAAMIRWSRAPMILLGMLTTLIFFWALRRYSGRVAAFVFLGLFLLNPAMMGWLAVAQSDMPVLFFVVLAIPPALVALERWRALPETPELKIADFNQTLLWLVLVGAAGGLAAAAKLNGFAAALAGSSLGVLLAIFDRRPIPARLRLSFAIRAAILPVLVGLVVMALLNPFLYPDPFGRLGKMLAYRAYEMNWQANTWPEYRVPGGWERVPYMLQRVLQDFSALQFPFAWVINAALLLVGLYVMLPSAWTWLRSQQGSPGSLALGVVGVWVSFPMLFTIVDWNRYYMFPVIFSSLVMAVGVEFVARRVWRKKLQPGAAQAAAPRG